MKHKHDMKHKFEEYFPLPWETTKEKDVVFVNGQGWNIPVIIAEGSVVECAEREALRYAVQCANLMPEVVEVLKQALDGIEEACCYHNQYTCPSCSWCTAESAKNKISALLAKLGEARNNGHF